MQCPCWPRSVWGVSGCVNAVGTWGGPSVGVLSIFGRWRVRGVEVGL